VDSIMGYFGLRGQTRIDVCQPMFLNRKSPGRALFTIREPGIWDSGPTIVSHWLNPPYPEDEPRTHRRTSRGSRKEPRSVVENDRYPLSPRILTLKEILNKIRPEPKSEPLPPLKHYEAPRAGRNRYGGDRH
jgi:hypothetical protein